ncbi:MAG: GNAT family N-acetyltransferase [Bacteroidales bacterium]|nr:GNAT family N-acetyltransferase [Bacteroidales bacterium]
MEPVIPPVDRKLIINELTSDKFIRHTRKGDNKLYEITAHDSPHTMNEIGRLREISFRLSGGGTGKSIDIDEFDIDPHTPYKQLLVWDPKDQEIIGGYRYIQCTGLDIKKMATHELFEFSDTFKNDYLPFTIELGRSFIQPNYQGTNIKHKGLYSLDNLWDGLGALVVKYPKIKYFFGKVTMYTSYNLRARNILLNFLNTFFPDNENLVMPYEPLDFDSSNPYYKELFKTDDYKESYKTLSKEVRTLGENIPPLINSYMNLSPSMKVFGTSINGGFGGVEETGILVNISHIYPEKIERYISPILQLAIKLRPKWWTPAKPHKPGSEKTKDKIIEKLPRKIKKAVKKKGNDSKANDAKSQDN